MKRSLSMRVLSIQSVALALTLSMSPGIELARAANGAGGTPGQSLDMVTVLRAASPSPALGDHANVMARLVGSWDVEYTDFRKDGTTLHRTGRLLFGWVVDGRVMQDVWIVDPWGSHADREVYTDLFYFDPKAATWRAASVDPYEASVATFTGRVIGAIGSLLRVRIWFPTRPGDGRTTTYAPIPWSSAMKPRLMAARPGG